MITTDGCVLTVAKYIRRAPMDGKQRPDGYPWPMAATHLSKAAYERLRTELVELTSIGRIDIARKIETARELGDLSENGDYHAAKEEQGKMEGRILHLERLLQDAKIVEAGGGDTVSVGSIVGIRYEGDDEVERYLIGSIEERQADLQVISPWSPLGSALMGATRGDQVSYEAPGGTLVVHVVTVK